jgi:UDP-glucose 4-epimerase
VAANLAALDRGSRDAFNIASGVPTSVNEIFASLKAITGFRGEPAYGPAKAGEVYRIYLDASRAGRSLGWRPRVGLEQGLRETVDYFRQRLAESDAGS